MTKGREERQEVIREALRYTRGNVTRAARHLGIHRVHLWWYMRRLEMGHEPALLRAAQKRRFRLPWTSTA
jgi:DNA-binding NtrC family response regulator